MDETTTKLMHILDENPESLQNWLDCPNWNEGQARFVARELRPLWPALSDEAKIAIWIAAFDFEYRMSEIGRW